MDYLIIALCFLFAAIILTSRIKRFIQMLYENKELKKKSAAVEITLLEEESNDNEF
ncbi:hypothetical protein [Syntrophomonas curvata]